MINCNYTCPLCVTPLTHSEQHLECPSCATHYPLCGGIPLFGNNDEVEQWTNYHTDPEKSRRVAGGAYLSEHPTVSNAYYSRFISDTALVVLDAGGGDGSTTSDFAERHPAATVYVMDLSLHGLVKVQHRNLPNMIPVCASADQRFPFPDEYFDVVSTVFMVEHMSPNALASFYREARRVLKPGGRLVIASDTRFYDAIIHPLERLIRNGKYIKNDPTHINLMTPSECEAGVSAEGFQLTERTIHWMAGRHDIARKLIQLLPTKFAEAVFSTMYVISARK
jgi:SAM-dependent methyltransferase